MIEVKIGGSTGIPIGNRIMLIEWVNWNERAWLAPLWLINTDKTMMRPVRLIGPKFAQGFTCPPGPEVLKVFQQYPLTEAVLEQGYVPKELAPVVEVIENPEVFVSASPKAH